MQLDPGLLPMIGLMAKETVMSTEAMRSYSECTISVLLSSFLFFLILTIYCFSLHSFFTLFFPLLYLSFLCLAVWSLLPVYLLLSFIVFHDIQTHVKRFLTNPPCIELPRTLNGAVFHKSVFVGNQRTPQKEYETCSI